MHALPADLHAGIAQALRLLKRENMFKKDIVWVNGTLSMTRVSRALLGQPGMTYRYKVSRWRTPAYAHARRAVQSPSRRAPDQTRTRVRGMRLFSGVLVCVCVYVCECVKISCRDCACFRFHGQPRQNPVQIPTTQCISISTALCDTATMEL